MTPTTTVDATIDRWATAEGAGDHAALNDLLTDDFLAAGPAGYLLDKQQWLERYRGDHLHYASFDIQDTQPRTYGDVTIVVGVQDQHGDHEGRPVTARLRLTLILSSTDPANSKIAGLHLSPIMAPPANPT